VSPDSFALGIRDCIVVEGSNCVCFEQGFSMSGLARLSQLGQGFDFFRGQEWRVY
jgi:hypothetical protein